MLQLICICALWAICAMDFTYGFTIFIIDLIQELRYRQKNQPSPSLKKKSSKSIII